MKQIPHWINSSHSFYHLFSLFYFTSLTSLWKLLHSSYFFGHFSVFSGSSNFIRHLSVDIFQPLVLASQLFTVHNLLGWAYFGWLQFTSLLLTSTLTYLLNLWLLFLGHSTDKLGKRSQRLQSSLLTDTFSFTLYLGEWHPCPPR